MIVYDSRNFLSIAFQLKGSVIPRAIRFALPATIIAMVAKLVITELGESDLEERILEQLGSNLSTAGFGTVSSVLGFMLVFRTSQAYSRYWEGKALVCKMRAEWFEACANLMAFNSKSKNSEQEKEAFRHVLVRLFSLLHASALHEIAVMEVENFEVLDIEGLDQGSLECLQNCEQDGQKKVALVFQWVLGTIVYNIDTGLLPVPPPILSRVFQQLSNGKVQMEDALKITDTQFPFPIAQMSVYLLLMYSLLTPVVVCVYTGHWFVTTIFTFAAVLVFWGINFIAIEIEEPFGDDINDLNLETMQQDLNEDLLALIGPACSRIPGLSNKAELSLQKLSKRTMCNQSGFVCRGAGDGKVVRKLEKASRSNARDSSKDTPQPPTVVSAFSPQPPKDTHWCVKVDTKEGCQGG
eukprot:gnl/MRDRNA2_/MRDRNA2_83820_c0_seq1.p1 gnl/MRDRNA2_/MRDRNA2_83820_c0~~gnl/MRDRNA2_/MRDRNA2_83820_c0_seq1.p1  ORF type:complete len:410 (-),score=62.05 gnl/MRDRNA2_/MRDRNA2_83820_c0_seq1:191-1420(-)